MAHFIFIEQILEVFGPKYMHSRSHLHQHILQFKLTSSLRKRKTWWMCFSERTCRWNSSICFFDRKVFKRERTTSPRWTIYCPSLGIPHDPSMGMESRESWNSKLILAVLSWLSDKTLSAALKSLHESL